MSSSSPSSSSSTARLTVMVASSFLTGIAVSQYWPRLCAEWHRLRRRIRNDDKIEEKRKQQNGETTESRTTRQRRTTAQNDSLVASPRPLFSSFERQLQHQPQKKKELCIGSIFGLDVGGTLTKLAYFEPTDRSSVRMMMTGGEDRGADAARSTTDLAILMEPFVSKLGTSSLYYGRSKQQQQQHHQRHSSSSNQDMARLSHADTTTDSSHSSTTTTYQKRWKPLRSSVSSAHPIPSLHLPEQEEQHPLIRSSRRSVPHNLQSLDDTALPHMSHHRRSRSMDNLVLLHNAALDVFYAFARQSRTTSVAATAADSFASATEDNNDNNSTTHGNSNTTATDTTGAATTSSTQHTMTTPVASLHSPALGGDFHLYRFPTQQLPVAMDAMRHHKLHWTIAQVGATGGGAHKFANAVQRELGITMQKQDEMDSLVAGLQFVLASTVTASSTTTTAAVASEQPEEKAECYTYKNHPTMTDTKSDAWQHWSVKQAVVQPPAQSSLSTSSRRTTDLRSVDHSQQQQYPYLVVVVGTGVSVLRVDGPRKYERVSGSTIGGGTFLGLIRVLTDVTEFDDGLRMAEEGDHSKVDMMVGDIYGDDNFEALEKLGLTAAIVASSFGKVTANRMANHNETSSTTTTTQEDRIRQEDLARALLLMITNNIGQVAHLNAKLYKTQRIYFVGNFLRHNTISQQKLSFAINYWSQGEMQALFLEHEGYFGALGAFLLSQGISIDGAGVRQWRYQGAASPPPTG